VDAQSVPEMGVYRATDWRGEHYPDAEVSQRATRYSGRGSVVVPCRIEEVILRTLPCHPTTLDWTFLKCGIRHQGMVLVDGTHASSHGIARLMTMLTAVDRQDPQNPRGDLLGRALLSLVCLGVLLRFGFLWFRGTLWLDEVLVALNMRESPSFLLKGDLFYMQRAPIGWLMLEKAFFRIVRHSDTGLRLPSLLAGSAALVIFADAARRVLKPFAALTVVSIMAFAPFPVYYSTELKHYSFELIAACIACNLLARSVYYQNWTRLALLFNVSMSVAALFGVAYSVVAALVAPAMAGGAKDWKSFVRRLLCLVPWSAFALAEFAWMSTRYGPEVDHFFREFWSVGFWPVLPLGPETLLWPTRWFAGLLQDIAGHLFPAVIGGLCILPGCVGILAKQNRVGLAMLGAVSLSLLISALGYYPPIGRLALILHPCLLLVIGMGFSDLQDRVGKGTLCSWTLGGLLAGATLYGTVDTFARGQIIAGPRHLPANSLEDLRRGFELLRVHNSVDARLLVPIMTIPATAFYAEDLPVPLARIWFEGKQPWNPRFDLFNNRALRRNEPTYQFGVTDSAGHFTPSKALEEFLDAAAQEGFPVILMATHGHADLARHAEFIRSRLGPFEIQDFPNGRVFYFPGSPTPGAAP
jgi:hypothetical protein